MTTTTDHHGTQTDGSSAELSTVIILLLKGVLYQDDHTDAWSSLLRHQADIRSYVSVLALELTLDEAEGYAFLRSRTGDDPEQPSVPRLIARRQLSYPVSLLLALLRKKLAEVDAGGGDTRLIMSRDDIADMIRIFLPAGSNETRLIDQVDSMLNKIADMGFVRRLRSDDGMYEVRRIIKAFVDAQWLADFDQRLQEYRTVIQPEE